MYRGGIGAGVAGGFDVGSGRARILTAGIRQPVSKLDTFEFLPSEIKKGDVNLPLLQGQQVRRKTLSRAQRGGAVLAGGKGGGVTDDQLASSLVDVKKTSDGGTVYSLKSSGLSGQAAALMGRKPGEILSNEELGVVLNNIRTLAKENSKREERLGPEGWAKLTPKQREDYTAGNVGYGLNKQGGLVRKEVSPEVIDYLNEQWDILAGYKDAHKYPERNWRIEAFNPLNEPGASNSVQDVAAAQDNIDLSLPENFNALDNATQEYINQVTDSLKKAFPDVRVTKDPGAYNDAVNELRRAGHDIPGYAKGLQYANNVLINPSQATKDTPIHEFAHRSLRFS